MMVKLIGWVSNGRAWDWSNVGPNLCIIEEVHECE